MYLKTDILFTTTGSICGREITDYLGILIEREAVPADIDSRERLYEMDARYASLAASMNACAADIGADAVVGVDFSVDRLGDKIVFTMTGNAVRLNSVCAAAEPQPEAAVSEELVFEEAAIGEVVPEESVSVEAVAEMPLFEVEEDVPGEAEEMPEDIFIFEEAEPEQHEGASSWQCHGCGTENDPMYRYCPRCGEMRRYDWKCDGCGQQNPPEYKFCPGCGKPCNG